MKISGIKKVVLSMEAGDRSGDMNMFTGPVSFEFIYGIGPSGLTPFERGLQDKGIGDELGIRIKREEMSDFFSHLWLPFRELSGNIEEIYLNLRVVDVAEADQREVIRAMAEMASCGDNCCGH